MRNQRTGTARAADDQTEDRDRGNGDRGGAVRHRRGARCRIGPRPPRHWPDPVSHRSPGRSRGPHERTQDRDIDLGDHLPGRLCPGRLAVGQLPFTRTVTYPATQASATETVIAHWFERRRRAKLGDRRASAAVPGRHDDDHDDDHHDDHPARRRPPPRRRARRRPRRPRRPRRSSRPVRRPPRRSGNRARPARSINRRARRRPHPVGRSLPATGNSSTSLVVIALTMIGIGAVMLRLTSRSTR